MDVKNSTSAWAPLPTVAGLGGLILDWLTWQLPGEAPAPDEAVRTLAETIAGDAEPPVWQGVPSQPQSTRTAIGIATRAWPRERGRFVYAAARLRATRPLEVAVRAGSYVGYRLWLDGVLLGAAPADSGASASFAIDDNRYPVTLAEGTHVLVVEIDRDQWQTIFHLRLSAPDGRDLPAGALLVAAVGTPAEPPTGRAHPLNRGGDIPPAFQFYNEQLNRPGELSLDAVSPEGWEAWQTTFRQRLRELLKMPDVAPPVAEVTWRREWQDVQLERVVLHDGPTGPIPLYALLPSGGNQPAAGVLCIHGHGAGKDDVAGVTAQDPAQAERVAEANFTYALQLAQRGYVTFAPDLRAFGERGDDPEGRRDPCDNTFMKALLLGGLPLAFDLADLRLVLEYALGRPEVDAQRFGCVGLSLGGRMTMFLAALDERIKVAVSSGAVNTFKERLTSYAACGSQLLPGLWRYGDTAEVFGLIAPRPLLLEVGTQDGTSPEVFAAEVYRGVRRAYALAGTPDCLDVDVYARGHRFNAVKALPFLERWLGER